MGTYWIMAILDIWYQTMLKYEVVIDDENMAYFRYGDYHRKDSPSYILRDGYMSWREYDQRHRKHGPAIVYTSGMESYYIRGRYVEIHAPC